MGTVHWSVASNNVFTFGAVRSAGTALGVDLRQPSTCDTPATHDMRFRLSNVLRCWMVGLHSRHKGKNFALCAPDTLYAGGVVGDYQSNGSHSASEGEGETCTWLVRKFPWERKVHGSDYPWRDAGGRSGVWAVAVHSSNWCWIAGLTILFTAVNGLTLPEYLIGCAV